MSTIFTRNDTWYIEYRVAGRTVRRSLRTEDAAEARAAQKRFDFGHGGPRALETTAQDAPGATIGALVESYPVRDGDRRQAQALAALARHAALPVAGYLPVRLAQAQAAWIAQGVTARTAGEYRRALIAVLRWGVGQGIVPGATVAALREVLPPQGRRTAPVQAVPRADVEAVLAVAAPSLSDMIRVQLLTGARPGEVLALAVEDLAGDRAHLARHKTAHRGHARTLYLPAEAQAILARHAAGRTEGCVWGRAALTASGYRKAVARACQRANVPAWHPHQLRHLAATEVQRAHGIDAARAFLGHRGVAITVRYVDQDAALGEAVAATR